MAYFDFVDKVKYEGPAATEPFAFRFYDPERIVLDRPMKEWLPFAMAWWHNLGAAGTDMFGRDTADKSFGAVPGTMEHAKAKVDAGFEFMEKLGIRYFCFHDVDLVPEADDIKETNRRRSIQKAYNDENGIIRIPLNPEGDFQEWLKANQAEEAKEEAREAEEAEEILEETKEAIEEAEEAAKEAETAKPAPAEK